MDLGLWAFGQVVLIDLLLAGDNAVVVGAMAARLPANQRRIALLGGIGGAVVARIVLSLTALWILRIPHMQLVGGLLLLWVAWRMWRDLRTEDAGEEALVWAAPSLGQAMGAIMVADVSMSLDNVIGVAGAAQGDVLALVFGLVLSVVVMGVAAAGIAALMDRFRWLGYVGWAFVVFVAMRMLVQSVST